MSPTRDEPVDRLLLQVSQEMQGALSRSFDLEVGLARIKGRAAAARKAALAEEAERLAKVTVGWEDAAVRLAEIETIWQEAGTVESATEDKLWRRFITARRAFSRQHNTSFGRQPSRPPTAPSEPEDTEGLSIPEAERRLRDLLELQPGGGPAWDEACATMAEYCLPTIIGWLRTGYVPVPCQLDDSERRMLMRPWPAEEMAEAAFAVARSAVKDFRHRRLPRGLWRPEAGVLLADELLACCASALPAILRTRLRRHPSVRGQKPKPMPVATPESAAHTLRAAGYHRAETAELVGLRGEAAVTRAVARHGKTARPEDV